MDRNPPKPIQDALGLDLLLPPATVGTMHVAFRIQTDKMLIARGAVTRHISLLQGLYSILRPVYLSFRQYSIFFSADMLSIALNSLWDIANVILSSGGQVP